MARRQGVSTEGSRRQMNTVGVRIRELRTGRGMTLTALARATGLSAGLISQVERRLTDPSLETLRRIARTLDVPLFSLFREPDADSGAVVIRRDRRMPGG